MSSVAPQVTEYYANFPKARIADVRNAFEGANLPAQIGFLEELGGYVRCPASEQAAKVFSALGDALRNVRCPEAQTQLELVAG